MPLNLTLKQVVGILGGWSVILVAVTGWLSHVLSERLFSKWRRDEQTSVEGIRSSLASDRLLLESAIRSLQTGQNSTQEKRLAAAEHLWVSILHLRDRFSGIVFFFDILLPDEYDSVVEKGGAMAASIANVNDEFIISAMQPVENIECERPYLGETLWVRFFLYRAFLGRLAVLINEGNRKHHFKDWKEDPGVRKLLSYGMSPELRASVLERPSTRATIRTAINALENGMLEEISLIVSGRSSAFESFRNAKDLQASLIEFTQSRNVS